MLFKRVRTWAPRLILCAAFFSGLLGSSATAQDAASPAAKPVTFLGTVQTLSGSTITVKNDAGVTMGHWHLNSRDIEANKKIFVALGGRYPKTVFRPRFWATIPPSFRTRMRSRARPSR